MWDRDDILRRLRKLLPNTLLGRALVIILTPLVLLHAVSTWSFYDNHYDIITVRLSQSLAGDIEALLAIEGAMDLAGQPSDQLRKAAAAMSLEVFFEPEATVPLDLDRKPDGYVDKRVWKAMRVRFESPVAVDSDRFRFENKVAIALQRPNGVLRILVPQERLFSSTSYIFLIWMGGTAFILFTVAIIFLRAQLRPLRRLAKAADNFGKGRDVGGFRPEGSIEMRQAAAAFLKMRERIKRQIQQRTEMLAGVSHDLRTPLTRMKLQLAMLGRTEEAANLQSDVEEMERMVEGYLAFARGEGVEQPIQADLGALLRDLVSQLRRDDRPIELGLEDNLILPLQRDAIRRCLTNLIANAQSYGRNVKVTVQRLKKTLEIWVEDDGPGIPTDRREEVFRPFARLDASRNPETGGTGLGLTIARDVARNHGGDIRLEEADNGGLRARVILPL